MDTYKIPLTFKHGRNAYIRYKCKCPICRKMAGDYQKGRVNLLRSKGRCISCGKPKPPEKLNNCLVCLRKKIESTYRRRRIESGQDVETRADLTC